MSDEQPIELAKAIDAVRDELVAASTRAAGKELTFSVGKVEVEFSVEAKTVDSADASVKFWVVGAGVKGERSSTTAHKVRIELEPQQRSLRVSGSSSEPPPR